jgi:hypothetical protein
LNFSLVLILNLVVDGGCPTRRFYVWSSWLMFLWFYALIFSGCPHSSRFLGRVGVQISTAERIKGSSEERRSQHEAR